MFSIRYTTVIGIVFLFTVTTAPAAQTGERSAVGNFDIDKVRELAAGSHTIAPDDSNAASVQQSAAGAQSYSLVVLRIIGSLALIIVLILVVSWIIRKAGLSGSSRIGRGGSMEVLEALPLGQNKTLALVRVMDTVYLCGQTASAITLLDKIEGQRVAELLTSGKGSSSVVQFKEAFNQFISRVKK